MEYGKDKMPEIALSKKIEKPISENKLYRKIIEMDELYSYTTHKKTELI